MCSMCSGNIENALDVRDSKCKFWLRTLHSLGLLFFIFQFQAWGIYLTSTHLFLPTLDNLNLILPQLPSYLLSPYSSPRSSNFANGESQHTPFSSNPLQASPVQGSHPTHQHGLEGWCRCIYYGTSSASPLCTQDSLGLNCWGSCWLLMVICFSRYPGLCLFYSYIQNSFHHIISPFYSSFWGCRSLL